MYIVVFWAYCSSVATVPLCPMFLCAYCSSWLNSGLHLNYDEHFNDDCKFKLEENPYK